MEYKGCFSTLCQISMIFWSRIKTSNIPHPLLTMRIFRTRHLLRFIYQSIIELIWEFFFFFWITSCYKQLMTHDGSCFPSRAAPSWNSVQIANFDSIFGKVFCPFYRKKKITVRLHSLCTCQFGSLSKKGHSGLFGFE